MRRHHGREEATPIQRLTRASLRSDQPTQVWPHPAGTAWPPHRNAHAARSSANRRHGLLPPRGKGTLMVRFRVPVLVVRAGAVLV